MAKNPPRDENSGAGDHRKRRNLSDAEVDQEFSKLTAQYLEDSLVGPRDYIPAEDNEPFTPPIPGRLTSTDPFLTLGWSLLVGGLLLMVIMMIIWPNAPRPLHLVCLGGSILGGGLLTWRMPKHRSDDDDPGAVV